MAEDETDVGIRIGEADTDRAMAAAIADPDDDTDRDVLAQGSADTTPTMFEDTGVVIVDRPQLEPALSDTLVVTFRRPSRPHKPRASTMDDWPPAPRAPAPLRERAFRRAGVYRVVTRPDT